MPLFARQCLACGSTLLQKLKLKSGPSQGGFSDGDTAGWTLSLLDGQPVKFSAVADSSGLSGTDAKPVAWYFTAPSTFSGNFVNAYNGKIEVTDFVPPPVQLAFFGAISLPPSPSQFTLTHTQVADSAAKKTPGPDVVLRAACGHSLLWSGAMDGPVSIPLHERAGWRDSRTGRPPVTADVLGVLNHLGSVMIRGGFYASAETTTIGRVAVYPGKVQQPTPSRPA